MTTIDTTIRPGALAAPLTGPTANRGAPFIGAAYQVAARTIKKFVRSPQLIVASTAQGALFLLIFRYVFGGAFRGTGGLTYVEFLVPGFVVTGTLFSGMGAAAGVADDLQSGLFDRLRSLPIRLLSIVTGRVSADTLLVTWGLAVTTLIGFLIGFRADNGVLNALAAFGLCILYGFVAIWVFVGLGFLAGTPQAAQGLSFLVFPLTFVSSAYVPVSTMPSWMQGFATHQPMTLMSNAVREIAIGPKAQAMLGHGLSTYLGPSLLWSVGIVAVFAPPTVWRLRKS